MSENARMFNEGSLADVVAGIDPEKPVLIAGPTASGKSALALEIAGETGGLVINADALQVYSDWRILTARPSQEEEARVPHVLYGHVPGDRAYSVGDWLREVTPLLQHPAPVIVGGTGLYFTALTEGLAEIPEVPDEVRATARARIAAGDMPAMLAELDRATAARIDVQNPMRVQRAWEVFTATGRGLTDWQAETGSPLLPLDAVQPLLIEAPKDWLNPRIEARFDVMLDRGALEEARQNAPRWHAGLPSAKAIGAAELVAYVQGEMTLGAAREAAVIATRQYAKRQRSWFRARMALWKRLSVG